MPHEHWFTTAVAALPTGWVNVYNGAGEDPCSVVLLQELRYTIYHDKETKVTRKEMEQPPYIIRVVYASCDEFGQLEPAIDTGNYVRTEFRG